MKGTPATPPATYSITREGLAVWHGGKAVLVIPREALPGVALRCLVAWHEGIGNVSPTSEKLT